MHSFGIVMYEIAARKLPFVDEYWMRFQRNGYFQARDCINAIIHEDCRPTPPGPDHCPPEFAQLMLVPTTHSALSARVGRSRGEALSERGRLPWVRTGLLAYQSERSAHFCADRRSHQQAGTRSLRLAARGPRNGRPVSVAKPKALARPKEEDDDDGGATRLRWCGVVLGPALRVKRV